MIIKRDPERERTPPVLVGIDDIHASSRGSGKRESIKHVEILCQTRIVYNPRSIKGYVASRILADVNRIGARAGIENDTIEAELISYRDVRYI